MKLQKMIDLLHAIELRYPGESIEVESFDENGYMTDDIKVSTEIIFSNGRKRVMVRGSSLEDKPGD